VYRLTDVLKDRKLAISMGQVRRLIHLEAIKVNGEIIKAIDCVGSIIVRSGDRIQIGKRVDFLVDVNIKGQESQT
jgi:ribosomal protein S4